MSVHVRVEVTVELTLEQPWSDAESVGVVDAAAKREAVETIRRMSTGVKGLRVIGVDAVSMTRSWVHHAPGPRAQFLTAGDWPRCEDAFCVSDELGCGRSAQAVSPGGVPTCCAWPSRLDRPLLGFPPYAPPPFEPSPICSAVMRRGLDEWFPPRGPCAYCGHHDARHRLWDTMIDRHAAGDSAEILAWDYDKPEAAVRAVLTLRPYQEVGEA